MALQQLLEEVTSPDTPIVVAHLVDLSNLEGEDLDSFKADWPLITAERRRQIVDQLAQLAEDNVELDFSAVFRCALQDEQEEVRANAISRLWEVEERALIRPLSRMMLEDASELVRAHAARAMGRFALLAEIGKLLEKDGELIAQTLLEVIDDELESLEVRRRAVESIAPLSLDRVPDIIEQAYEDEYPPMQASAVFAMGRTCDPRWLTTLTGELDNTDAEMRYEAAVALGELGEEEAVVYLIPVINDTDAEVQAAAIEALGDIGGRVAKTALRQAEQHEDQRIRDLATSALESMEFHTDPLADLSSGN